VAGNGLNSVIVVLSLVLAAVFTVPPTCFIKKGICTSETEFPKTQK
jgi:hypothetical protein